MHVATVLMHKHTKAASYMVFVFFLDLGNFLLFPQNIIYILIYPHLFSYYSLTVSGFFFFSIPFLFQFTPPPTHIRKTSNGPSLAESFPKKFTQPRYIFSVE